MVNNESTIKVKLWHVFVAMFAIIAFVFTLYIAIQKDVDARQDESIKEKLGTNFKEQYYRDIANIDKKFDSIMKEIKRLRRYTYGNPDPRPGP